jgi:hypothetical protein
MVLENPNDLQKALNMIKNRAPILYDLIGNDRSRFTYEVMKHIHDLFILITWGTCGFNLHSVEYIKIVNPQQYYIIQSRIGYHKYHHRVQINILYEMYTTIRNIFPWYVVTYDNIAKNIYNEMLKEHIFFELVDYI